jgi:hypothetical protein
MSVSALYSFPRKLPTFFYFANDELTPVGREADVSTRKHVISHNAGFFIASVVRSTNIAQYSDQVTA